MKKDKKSIGIIISGIVIMIIAVVFFCFLQNSSIMVAPNGKILPHPPEIQQP